MKKLLIKSLSSQSLAMDISPIICQNKACLPAFQAVTKEHLFEHINYLLENNINTPIAICEADPTSKTCIGKGISIPVITNNAQVNLDILSARLIDTKKLTDSAGVDLIIDYKTKAGNIFPTCQTAFSRLGILNQNAVQVIAPEFSCNLTHTTPSSLSLAQYVDYINFDTGNIGVHYASNNAANQNKTGYMLLSFEKKPHIPSHPAFPMPEVAKLVQSKIETPAHTKVDPVWMKPTPFLNLEKPTIASQDCMNTSEGCPNLTLNMQGHTPHVQHAVSTQNVASTTGLIEQDKVILPPTQGIRKTITTRKQIIEEGKPVSVEEEVVHYIQESPSAPLKAIEPIKQEEIVQPQEIASPQMPKMVHPIVLIEQQPLPEYIVPQDIILSNAEIEAINKITPSIENQAIEQQNNIPALHSESPVIIQDKSITKEEPSSLLDNLSKYFYF